MGTCSRRVSFGLQDFKIGYRSSYAPEIRKEQHSIDGGLLKEYTDHKHQTANGRDNGCGKLNMQAKQKDMEEAQQKSFVRMKQQYKETKGDDETSIERYQHQLYLARLGSHLLITRQHHHCHMQTNRGEPFHMGTVSDVIAGGTEGAVQQGPVRARVLNDLSAEEKERYKADIRATNILLQEEHEVNANENRTMMERFLFQPTNDPLALVSNASVQQYPTQSSKSPQPSNEPSPADKFQLDSRSSSTENLIESLSNYLPSSPQLVVVQDVRGRYNANNQGKISEKQCKRKCCSWECRRSEQRRTLLILEKRLPTVDDDVDDSPRMFWHSMWTMMSLTAEEYDNDRKKAETSVPKLISALTVYPPNTLVKLVHRILQLKEAPDFNSFFKIKNLEHQIQEKDNVIRNLKVLVANVNDKSCEPYNAKDVTALIEQNDCVRVELEKVKQHYKELYDSIKITRAHTSEKTSTMLNEIESLKASIAKQESSFTSE
ncbi:hypothetical protein Tco_1465579 [Tanacetum coccineum]